MPWCPAPAAATPVRCLQLLRTAKAALGEILSAFEFLDRQALQLTLEHLPEAADPLPGQQAPIYVLLETSGSNEEHDHAKLQVGWRGAVPVCWCRWQRAELLPMAPHAGFQILGLGLTCHTSWDMPGPAPEQALVCSGATDGRPAAALLHVLFVHFLLHRKSPQHGT